jgi:GT2 family glycosyltransferase
MGVSVIVSNFNGATYLPRLIESLQAQRDVQLEIIVVDRKSCDESRELLERYPSVTVCEEPPETGLVCGYASAVHRARYPHLFFCNEDMWFEENCLHLLESRIDLERRVAVADPWQWTYDGKTWVHGVTRFRPCRWSLLNAYPFRRNSFNEFLPDASLVPFPCAGAFMIHRSVYDEVGGWDRSFFLDFEDVDLGVRLWQHGWKCVSVPGSKVYHAVNASNNKALNAKTKVSKRRYISGRANVAVIGLKYFTGLSLLFPGLVWVAMAVNNLRHLNPRLLWWDILAAAEILRNLPAVLAYRRRYGGLNRLRRCRDFFCAPEFEKTVEDAQVSARSTLQLKQTTQ